MLFLIDSENPVNSKDESTLTDSAVTKAAPESPRGGVCLGSLGAFCALLVQSPPLWTLLDIGRPGSCII